MPGDEADYLIDKHLEGGFDEGYFGDEDSDGDNVVCKRCGASGLWWLNTGVRWRLYEGDEPHQCAIVASADDFEALP